jgi:cation:H+ antiporter
MSTALPLIALGLVLLTLGAEALVRGASRLAELIGIPRLVIGLTVVTFGTASPELTVSLYSALTGQGAIALGNAVGSSIFNVLFILGLSALIAPLAVSAQLVRWDVPIMIVVSIVLLLCGLDGRISRLEGTAFFLAYAGYTLLALRQGRREGAVRSSADPAHSRRQDTKPFQGWLGALGLAAVGLGLLVLGSRSLLTGAVTVARALGVSDLIIGLTIVAVGTSLPEVATSVIASIRGERDIAVGNVVGSSIFNILAVLGLVGALAPQGLPVPEAALSFDIPVLIATAVACLPVFLTGSVIARWEGLLFLGYYVAYTLYLILDSSGHDALPAFSAIMIGAVIPLTAATILTLTVRAFRTRGKKPA